MERPEVQGVAAVVIVAFEFFQDSLGRDLWITLKQLFDFVGVSVQLARSRTRCGAETRWRNARPGRQFSVSQVFILARQSNSSVSRLATRLPGGATGGEQVDDIGEFSRGQCGVGG